MMAMETPDPTAAAWDWTKSVQLEDGTKLHILRLGAGLISEYTLARIYLGLADAKLLQVVWPGEVPSLSWWMQWVAEKRLDGGPRNVVMAAYVQKGTELTIAGFGSIATITYLGLIGGEPRYKAECGFGFLPSTHKTRLPMEFGEMMLDYGFESLGIEVAYGTTPKPNKLACRFAERLGLEVVGVLPIYGPWMSENGLVTPCDYQVACLTREKWEKAPAREKRELVEA
jgi:RimJ/RimL family protein N-acetyltransferase